MSHLPSRLALGAGLFLLLILGPAFVVVRGQDKKADENPKAEKEVPKEEKEAPKEEKEAPKAEKEAPKEEKEAPKLDEVTKEYMRKLLEKAQEEYRLYFKRPQTVPEFWAAINFEVDVGKFDVAALLLDQLLKREPAENVDRDLAAIEEARGMSAFLRFRNVSKWQDNAELEKQAEANVQALINRVTAAVERRLSDPVRLNKLIGGLAANPEEKNYAVVQLLRAGARVTPYLVDALRRTAGTPDQERIKDMLLRLDKNAMLPLFEVLRAHDRKDAQDVELRVALLDVVKQRDDQRFIPYLWHLSAASLYPPLVRERARDTLASLLRTTSDRLPAAKEALTELAEHYYHHRVKFTDPKHVRLWPWDGQKLARKPVELSAAQAEQFFGLLFADEALDLDPAYRPAQEVMLDLTLERTFAPALDQVLQKKLPDSLSRLLATIDSQLLLRALERALSDRNEAVILPLVRALGERGEARAALPAAGGEPRGLLRALYYPDRRVQMAAVKEILRLPLTPEPATAARVVDVLRRFVAAEPGPVALAAFVPQDRAAALRKALKDAGFEPVLTTATKDTLARLEAAADVDVIVVHFAVPPAELPYLLGQLRSDSNTGLLPLLLASAPQTKDSFTKLAERYPNVWVVPEGLFTMPDALKARLDESIKLALAPADVSRLPADQKSWVVADVNRTQGQKLSAQERKQFALESLDYLWQMARGEIRGYDIMPARGAVEKVLRSGDLGLKAVEILGRLPGTEVQQRLAWLAIDPSAGKVRVPAAVELNRHIRQSGLLLGKAQLDDIRREYNNPKADANLRTEFALVLSHLGTGSRVTGLRLRNFTPDAAPAPPQKKE